MLYILIVLYAVGMFLLGLRAMTRLDRFLQENRLAQLLRQQKQDQKKTDPPEK